MRRFVALLELGELLLRVGDVGLVRAAELKELPLATKIQLSGIELGLVIFRFRGPERLRSPGSLPWSPRLLLVDSPGRPKNALSAMSAAVAPKSFAPLPALTPA